MDTKEVIAAIIILAIIAYCGYEMIMDWSNSILNAQQLSMTVLGLRG